MDKNKEEDDMAFEVTSVEENHTPAKTRAKDQTKNKDDGRRLNPEHESRMMISQRIKSNSKTADSKATLKSRPTTNSSPKKAARLT